jgi:hypothetical protein
VKLNWGDWARTDGLASIASAKATKANAAVWYEPKTFMLGGTFESTIPAGVIAGGASER